MRVRARIAGAVLAALAAAGVAGQEAATPAEPPPAPDADGLQPVAYQEPVDAARHGSWLTARLHRPAMLRVRPGGPMLSWLSLRTRFGSPRVLGVLSRRGGWLRVLSPDLANGRSGWIRSRDAAVAATGVSVTVDRSSRRLELRDGPRLLDRFRIGVGRPGTPTPLGRFAVTDKLPMAAGSPYGRFVLALTGHQPHLPQGWSGGNRLAIHGTPEPGSLGEAASLGCVRAPERGLRVLMRRVPLGAPVFIRR
jgi:lipoprotein-anchoring transpeptidase ErfK/SrfK